MPLSEEELHDVSRWLKRARSNLARSKADRHLPEVMYEDLCFDAQQAAVKAIKAVLVYEEIPFPKTHDIIDLLTLLDKAGIEIGEELRKADILTSYAAETRYPGISEEVSEEDYQQAVELAVKVVHWAESLIPPMPESE